jgi:hypothetical protein
MYYRWPNGVIPYVIESTIATPAYITAAVEHWNTKLAGVITLVPRTTQTDYVRFIGGSGCSSSIGKVGAGQSIKLAAACTTGNVIHEIGHAVGLYHEQSREDRNTWVKINIANIAAGSTSNFSQPNSSADDLTYYAFNSIMHYNSTAFTANGLPTIETLPAGIPIGQRDGLDISDIAAVRKLYNKQTATVSVSSVPAGLTVTVDGVATITPASFNWPAGSVHTITAPTVAAAIAPSQHTFVRWSDGGALSHSIVVPTTGLAVAATYALQHKLTTTVATSATGTLAASPAPANLMYGSGSIVGLTATAASGYCFSAWTGLAAGTPSETTVAMNRSVAASAIFIPGAITPALSVVTVPATGGSFTIDTTATTGCGWMIRSSQPWLTVSKSYATSAAASFTYTAQANTTGLARTASITIGSKVVSVTQTP